MLSVKSLETFVRAHHDGDREITAKMENALPDVDWKTLHEVLDSNEDQVVEQRLVDSIEAMFDFSELEEDELSDESESE